MLYIYITLICNLRFFIYYKEYIFVSYQFLNFSSQIENKFHTLWRKAEKMLLGQLISKIQ